MSDDSAMDKKTFAARLLENTPLALVLIGLVFIILGANGGCDLRPDLRST
jgi:hypothetical protein